MTRFLIFILFILTACENVHNIYIVNNTKDTLIVTSSPPINEWSYTLNQLNGYIGINIDSISGDTIQYTAKGKSMDYLIAPNSKLILESAEGLPLSEDNLKLNKLLIKKTNNQKVKYFKNKKKIIKNCTLLNDEEESVPNKTTYEIKVE